MPEEFSNNASATLTASVTAGGTTLTVDSTAKFPQTGLFRLRVDDELMLADVVDTTTLTVTRGIEGTTAASHSSGAKATHVLTAGGLQAWWNDGVATGTYANRSSVSPLRSGQLYLADNSRYISRYDGAAWREWGPIMRLNPPVLSDFAWVNQGSAVADTSRGGISLRDTNLVGGTALRILKRAAPSPPYNIDVMVLPNIFPSTVVRQVGLCWRQSSTGRLHTFQYQSGPEQSFFLRTSKYNSPTSFNADYLTQTLPDEMHAAVFLRIQDSGSFRVSYWSMDGINWVAVHSVSRTDFLTADEWGFFINVEAAGGSVGGWFLHYNVS